MPTSSTLLSFAVAATALILLPGPNVFYLIGRGVTGGRGVALVAVAGVESATAVFAVGAALGLSAVLASSAIAFGVVRYAGAAYLFYLAYRTLRAGSDIERLGDRPVARRRAFAEAFLVGITNPKVALFFLAFFPQFIDPARGPVAGQTLILGAIFVGLGTMFDLCYASASGAIGRLLQRRPRMLARQRYVSAVAYAGLGVFALVSGGGRRR